ncbi:hypothetical protein OEA41_006976 [Lepraria neglecta]|uniref:Uncharacterized protein n=1 Tax=Lepraria neglecta TaxID=209136 RepID=A0AAD9Z8Z1_9LECA|nr:hypothetical protein OEA41_006976 [Lepraria neglecta]
MSLTSKLPILRRDMQLFSLASTIFLRPRFRFNSQKSITVLGQLDSSPDLVVASVPSITSIQDLKGKTIMVDKAMSGYAYYPAQDPWSVVGGTRSRYQYLLNGKAPDGTPACTTILTYPFTAEGLALPPGVGINALARASDFVNPFSSSAFTATTSVSNSTEAALLTRFLTPMLEANQYLADTKHKYCTIEAIATQLNISSSVAEAEYAAATDPETGETALMQEGVLNISRQSLLNAIDIRAQFGGFAGVPAGFEFAEAIVPGPSNLIDYTMRDQALKAVTDVKIKGSC